MYAFPAKERATNQRSYVERAERRFESAEEGEESKAAAALQAATNHRQTLAADLKQAKEALSQFETLADSPFKAVSPSP